MKRLTHAFFLFFILSSSPILAQFAMYDPDIQNFTLKGDSFYVETELITTVKHRKIKPDDTRIYTWALGGQIQSNQGGYTGRLLHGDYTSINNDHTMREQGGYWYPNGRMKKTVTWHRGILRGDFADFDEDGNVVRLGEYKKDKIEGRVLYYDKNAPSKMEYYHRGIMLRSQDLASVNKGDSHPVVAALKKLFKKKAQIETKSNSKEVLKK
jgi:hypothetical protein